MKKNKFLDKFNKTTLFLSLLILVLLYILYIHNTNYDNLFENFSLISNDFVNPCDEGYPHFYMSSSSQHIPKPNADEISCNFLCKKSNCAFYTISGRECYNYNTTSLPNNISVNCNKKDTIISDISDKYIGIGFIKEVDDISLLKYHDQHLYTINKLINNKDSLDNRLDYELNNSALLGSGLSLSNELIYQISTTMLEGVSTEDIWGYMNVSGVRFFKDKYLDFIDNSFNRYLDDLSLNRGYNGWSYLTELSNNNGDISDNYPNPERMIKVKQNTKDIEQTNEDLEEYTKKKTQFVYMFLLILIFLTAIILTLYFIVPNIVNDLILIIYFIGIFSILFYLKGYL